MLPNSFTTGVKPVGSWPRRPGRLYVTKLIHHRRKTGGVSARRFPASRSAAPVGLGPLGGQSL